ncbi:hypothetical protein Tco_1403413 [Tanacetum coccineum]
MTTTAAQQVALDNALVPLEKRVEIDKCNMRIDPAKTKKEPHISSYFGCSCSYYLLSCFSHHYRCSRDLYATVLICPRLPNKDFDEIPTDAKLYPSLKNLATKEMLNLSLKCITQDEKKNQETCFFAKKRTLVIIEEEEPKPAKKAKKALAKAERSKGIELLSDAILLEEAQMKKALRRIKRDTTIHQAGGSSEGVDFKIEFHDKPKGKLIDTSEGTGLKPGVPDVSKANSSDSENESWGDSGDEDTDDQQSDDERIESDDEQTEADNLKTTDDEEQTQDDKYVHTPKDYVPTDDETNDESKEFDKEEYEELYGDVNISLKDAELADKEKDDEEMTVAGHMNVNQEGARNQVNDDAQVTQKTEVPIPSSFISSDL